MKWTSALAIYMLFWSVTLFLVLPFGVKTADEIGAKKVKGQADSAPAHFNGRKIALRTTIVATLLFAVFYLNFTYNWITLDDISFFHPPANAAQ
ncbi:MAG: DUF1467 family protein [Alphaproteobacteria bacterium]|nr:DUF1467 family protein [Alphaproteobacteria bacterium]